jgi:hypothetical protein
VVVALVVGAALATALFMIRGRKRK